MRLSDVLKEDAILVGIQGLDKWGAIERLTELLVASGQIESERRRPILEALLARERSMSTGMENGIAIPHCSVDSIDHTLVSIGISRDGIDFESIDGSPTHLIFLLVTPKNRTKDHIKTLAEIPDKIHLLSPNVIDSIGSLKEGVLKAKTVSLDLDEALIALSISAATNPTAQLAMEKLHDLRGCEVHLTHIPTPGDEAGLRRLGVNLTSDANFSSNALFQAK